MRRSGGLSSCSRSRQSSRALPPSERAHLAVFTSNYGEAGAVHWYGPALGLPSAYSGHSTFWLWGPPPETGHDCAAGRAGRDVLRWCSSSAVVATVSNPVHVHNDEYGAPITVCRLAVPWSAIWPAVRHYDRIRWPGHFRQAVDKPAPQAAGCLGTAEPAAADLARAAPVPLVWVRPGPGLPDGVDR